MDNFQKSVLTANELNESNYDIRCCYRSPAGYVQQRMQQRMIYTPKQQVPMKFELGSLTINSSLHSS